MPCCFVFGVGFFRLLWGITSLCSFPLAVYAELQDNERILANIKSSLLEYALDNKAYVSANSWISGSGSIEEELLVFNRLDLEDLRFQTFDYGRGERGSRLYNVNDANISKGFGSRLRARKENGACELPNVAQTEITVGDTTAHIDRYGINKPVESCQ